jgi:nicotinate phosphoribosyltransferase
VLASGDLDEFRIEELLARGAPIDAFGVGTSLGVGAGDPGRGLFGGALAAVYKSVWYDDGTHPPLPVIKSAGEKSTRPGRKQVYRVGDFDHDMICEEAEPPPDRAVALLKPVMRDGHVLPGSRPSLAEAGAYARATLARLPERMQALVCEQPYLVRFSATLEDLRARALARHTPLAAAERSAHGDEP